MQPLGDFRQRNVFPKEQAPDLAEGKIVNPVRCRTPADSPADIRKVMRGDAQKRSEIRQVTATKMFASVEQLNEALQELPRPFGNRFRATFPRVDVIQIEDVRHQQMFQQLPAKQVSLLLQPPAQTDKVVPAPAEIGRGELHHRILQQRQMPDDTIIAAQRQRRDKRFGNAKANRAEIRRAGKGGRQRSIGKDNVILRNNVVPHFVENKTHAAFRTQKVQHRIGRRPPIETACRIDKKEPATKRLFHRCM